MTLIVIGVTILVIISAAFIIAAFVSFADDLRIAVKVYGWGTCATAIEIRHLTFTLAAAAVWCVALGFLDVLRRLM